MSLTPPGTFAGTQMGQVVQCFKTLGASTAFLDLDYMSTLTIFTGSRY